MSAALAPTLAEGMAEWVVGLRWGDVPEVVRRSTVESVLASVAGGVAGLEMPETQVALAYARALGESGPATVLGDGMRVPLSTAVFVNSVLWCALEQQEMHVPSRTHPHEVIVPVAMTLAEGLHPDGVSFLEAVLAGVEVCVALGRTAVDITSDIAEGLPGSAGVVMAGAAATASRLMGLDVETTALALSHAANFGAGLTEGLRRGSTEYHYTLANASAKGLLAAQLAAAGAEATMTQFEGGSGLYAHLTRRGGADLEVLALHDRIMGLLGVVWGMPEHIYKRYPVHFPCLPLLDGALGLRNRYGITADRVAEVRLRVNEWIVLCDGLNMGPYVGREASRGAAAFLVAMMLARGRYDHDDAYDLADPVVLGLVARTSIEVFEDRSNDCWELVRVEVVDVDGVSFVYDSTVEGIPDYRLAMTELRTLAEAALRRVLAPGVVTEVLDTLAALDTCPDVATLTPLLLRTP